VRKKGEIFIQSERVKEASRGVRAGTRNESLSLSFCASLSLVSNLYSILLFPTI